MDRLRTNYVARETRTARPQQQVIAGLYQGSGANASTAVFLIHETANFITATPCLQLVQRGLFVQLVAPWHEHPISTAYLEYNGNSHTVKPSNRLAALAGRCCSHFHPADRGDAFFGRRRGLAPFVH